MAGVAPQELLDQLKATNGKVITCKAAVAWEAKKPLDITDIQVMTRIYVTPNCFVMVSLRLSLRGLARCASR